MANNKNKKDVGQQTIRPAIKMEESSNAKKVSVNNNDKQEVKAPVKVDVTTKKTISSEPEVRINNNEIDRLKAEIKSLSNKLLREKEEHRKTKQEVVSTTIQSESISKDTQKLRDRLDEEIKIKTPVIHKKGYVAKETLSKETIIKRLNWWYNDLSKTQRFVAQMVCLSIVLVVGYGSSEALNNALTKVGIEGFDVQAYITGAVLSLLGISAQFKSLSLPNKEQ